jgi:UDP-N-acetylmuramoyl-tripeptide--D-alanyl-D-alanine ligase
MVAHVLSAAGRNVLATRGNLNSQIGLPIMVMGLGPAHTHAVFEMGASEKGNIASLASVARPNTGVITNIGRAHLEFFGSQEGVADAKWEMVESLSAEGLAVLNADDPRLMARRPKAKSRVATFGLGPSADVRGEDLRQSPETSFVLSARGKKFSVKLSAPGLFNVLNALAAAAVALEEGLSAEEIAAALPSFRPPAQRMQARKAKGGADFIVDAYNANPDSMAASLESFARAYAGRPRIAVLGGMRELGPAARDEHRALGELLARLKLESVFFLGPEGAWVKEGFPSLREFADKAALREALGRASAPGAVFLFKASRGVKLEDIYEPLIDND